MRRSHGRVHFSSGQRPTAFLFRQFDPGYVGEHERVIVSAGKEQRARAVFARRRFQIDSVERRETMKCFEVGRDLLRLRQFLNGGEYIEDGLVVVSDLGRVFLSYSDRRARTSTAAGGTGRARGGERLGSSRISTVSKTRE